MKRVTIRIELRIPEKMNDYLATEASARKLSFEGLLVSWIQERMDAERERAQRRSPR